VQVDIRFEDQIEAAIAKAAETFGGIDVVINNASAIQLTGTEQTESKKFDLIHSINVRGTFLVVKHALPYLKKGNNPHILTLSPPINMDPRWLGPHVAYTISKFNMSMLAIGWAQEFKAAGIASNAIWPKTTIDTAAVRNLLGGQALANMSRTTDIMADAAYYILKQKGSECTGHTFTDEEVLAKEGITNLDHYAVVPGGQLFNDLFV
jgi:NAD(P)-dependent dehydrogenase (short-subunit alcohol dehydrogenase family)